MFMASQHKNHPPVCVTRTVTVHPKVLPPKKILSLSNLDRQCPMLMYVVFFYKPTFAYQNLSLNSVFDGLKSGLEETLSVWYPAAGRLSLSPSDGRLNLWCNNDGAILVEAVTQAKILELEDLSQYNEFYEDLVFKPVFNGNFSDMPLVVAQVTRFGCGGYSIGIGTSHSLFDGPAAYSFLTTWASNSSIIKEKTLLDDLPKPVHERPSLLLGDNFQTKSTKASNQPSRRAAAIDHLYQLINQTALIGGWNNYIVDDQVSGSSNKRNFVLKTFHLSGAIIEDMKRKVLGERRSSFSCSSFEFLAAHLWKARTKALGVRKESMVCLQFAVDTRNKVVPSLPMGFSGNAFVLSSVALMAKELEQGTHESIIEKIKEAKNSINNDYVKAYIEALEGSSQANLPPLKELTLVSDWTRMPLHRFNFLQGQADYACPLVSPIPQVAYFMQNPKDFRDIDMRIGLPPQALEAFSHYFLINIGK